MPRSSPIRRLAATAVLLGLLGAGADNGVRAEDSTPRPFHERIDRLVERGRAERLAAPAADSELLRRLYLDLNGMIPTAEEARAFLDDPSPYKRSRLVDHLLDRPEFARRMANAFDVMLMERRPTTNVPADQWQTFLRDAFARNLPYDDLVRRILSADGIDPTRRGASRFLLDRNADPNVLVRDVGRLFLGRDMQCAQCHDHPLIDDYHQAHYYGLFAYFNRTYTVQDARGLTVLGEKADGDVSYSSVFKKKITHTTGPRIIEGPAASETAPAKGQEYWVYPGDKVVAIPRASRRSLLPEALTSTQNRDFARNIANRLWALTMGRGLVHPLDMAHSENPASNPELLDLLASEFVAMGYDVRRFVRELALTRTYQRSSEPPPLDGAPPSDPATFSIALVRPLSPEQLGWSVLQATGYVASYRAQAESDLFGKDPRLAAIASLDPPRRRLRDELLERRVHEQLSPSVAPFIGQFAAASGQPQDNPQSTVHQALFLANGDAIQSWINPSGSNLVARLIATSDPSLLAEEMYLAILTRRPSFEERQDVVSTLASAGPDGRALAIRELAWALLASAEFRFNH